MEEEPLIETEETALETLHLEALKNEDILRATGKWGRWQMKIYLIVYIYGSLNFSQTMAIVFYIPEADHWCKAPHIFYNWTESMWKNYSLPPSKENPTKFSECLMYNRNYSYVPDDPFAIQTDELTTISCQFGWAYDTTHFTLSIENEWDLVCEREFWAKTAQSTFTAGLLVGVVFFGQISDLYGRRITIRVTAVMAAIAGYLATVAPTYWLFNAARFFIAVGTISSFTAGFVLIMEITDTSNRVVLAMLGGIGGPLSYILLTGIAYYVHNWRVLQAIISVPLLIFLPLLWRIPESVRWLLTHERPGDAYKILKKAATQNKREFPSYDKFNFSEDSEDFKHQKTRSVIDLFRFPNLRKRTLILFITWFVTSFVYYGIAFGINSLGGNMFLDSFLSAGVEIPSQFVCLALMMKYGRRWNLYMSLLLCGVACLLTMIFNKGDYTLDWPIVTLAMVGKFGIHATFNILYIYSSEIFPTVARNGGLGASSMCARVGSIISPFLDLLRHSNPKLPLVCYGILSVFAGSLAFFLPETKDRPIPETIEDAENLGRKRHTLHSSPSTNRFSLKSLVNRRSFV